MSNQIISDIKCLVLGAKCFMDVLLSFLIRRAEEIKYIAEYMRFFIFKTSDEIEEGGGDDWRLWDGSRVLLFINVMLS